MNLSEKLEWIVKRLAELERDTDVMVDYPAYAPGPYDKGRYWRCCAENESTQVHMGECGGGAFETLGDTPEEAVDKMIALLAGADVKPPPKPYVPRELPPGTFTPQQTRYEFGQAMSEIFKANRKEDALKAHREEKKNGDQSKKET